MRAGDFVKKHWVVMILLTIVAAGAAVYLVATNRPADVAATEGPIRLFDREDFRRSCLETMFPTHEMKGFEPPADTLGPVTPAMGAAGDTFWFFPLPEARPPQHESIGRSGPDRLVLAGREVARVADESALLETSAPAWCYSSATAIAHDIELLPQAPFIRRISSPFRQTTLRIYAEQRSVVRNAALPSNMPPRELVIVLDDKTAGRVMVPATKSDGEWFADVPLTLATGSGEVSLRMTPPSDRKPNRQMIVINRLVLGPAHPGIYLRTGVQSPAPEPVVDYFAADSVIGTYLGRRARWTPEVQAGQTAPLQIDPYRYLRFEHDDQPNTLTTLRAAALATPAVLGATLAMPSRARLSFHYLFLEKHQSELPITFRLIALPESGGAPLGEWRWSSYGQRESAWIPCEADLSSLAGKTVRLEFTIEAAQEIALQFYLGEPMITTAAGAQQRRPNIILVSLDTLRADHVSAYGHDRPTTPNLDALATRSARFARVWSAAPNTGPSHLAMLTGFFPALHEFLLTELDAMFTRLSPSIPSLATYTRAAGYRTAAFTGGGYMTAVSEFNRDFDEFNEQVNMFWTISDLKGVRDRKEIGFRRALNWIERNADGGSFFLFLHTYAPHSPYAAPPEYDDTFSSQGKSSLPPFTANSVLQSMIKEFTENPDLAFDADDLAHIRTTYDRGILWTDTAVGELIHTLDIQGVLDNTILVITSDHGEEFFEHRGFLHNTGYNELLSVPLIVHYPAAIPADSVIRQPIQNVDLTPTILDLAGLPVPDFLHGRSRADLLRGAASEAPGPPLYFSMRRHWMSVMSDRYKLHVRHVQGDVQFFDIAADPGEQRDLYTLGAMPPWEEQRFMVGALLTYLGACSPGWNVMILPKEQGVVYNAQVDCDPAIPLSRNRTGGQYPFSHPLIAFSFGQRHITTTGGGYLMMLGDLGAQPVTIRITRQDAAGKAVNEAVTISPGFASNRRTRGSAQLENPETISLFLRPDEFAHRYAAIADAEVVIWFNPLQVSPSGAESGEDAGEQALRSLRQLGYIQ